MSPLKNVNNNNYMTNLLSEEKRKETLGFACLAVLIVIILSMSACNPVKRVMKDPKKVEKIAREWEKTNPCVVDSVIVNIPGKTVTTVDSIEFSTYLLYIDSLNDEFLKVKDSISREEIEHYARTVDSLLKHPVTIRVNSYLHDTLKVAVRDIRHERLLNDSIDYYHGVANFFEGKASQAIKDKDKAEDERSKAKTKNTIQIISFLLLIAVYLFLRFYFKLRI